MVLVGKGRFILAMVITGVVLLKVLKSGAGFSISRGEFFAIKMGVGDRVSWFNSVFALVLVCGVIG